jgi:transcriptional regulator with XRE-family HTH domain
MSNPVGARIRAIRKAQKRTQVEVASAAGMSQSYYTDIENGKKTPNLERYSAIATALNVSVGDIVDPSRAENESSRHAGVRSVAKPVEAEPHDYLSHRVAALPRSDQAILLRVLEGLEASNRGQGGVPA